MDNDRRVREVAERAGVIEVEVRLDDVGDLARVDAQSGDLGGTVLLLGHVRDEDVGQATQVGMRVASDRERIAAVDDRVAVGMADQEEGHRDRDAVQGERSAVEQVDLHAVAILCGRAQYAVVRDRCRGEAL